MEIPTLAWALIGSAVILLTASSLWAWAKRRSDNLNDKYYLAGVEFAAGKLGESSVENHLATVAALLSLTLPQYADDFPQPFRDGIIAVVHTHIKLINQLKIGEDIQAQQGSDCNITEL